MTNQKDYDIKITSARIQILSSLCAPNGKFGGCVNFDETYGFVIPRDVFRSISTALTISVWVNCDPNQPDHANVIFVASAGSGPWVLSIVRVETQWKANGIVALITGYGDDEQDAVRFNAAPVQWAGGWQHYAFVKDSEKGFQSIFLNGNAVAEETGTRRTMAGVEDVRIGIAPHRYGDQYIGKLDDLRIYNYALSESEIKALYAGEHVGTAKKTSRRD